MVEITKENINSAQFIDKHWNEPIKRSFIKKISKENKIVISLFGAVAIFTIINITLIYSFYKLLIKL